MEQHRPRPQRQSGPVIALLLASVGIAVATVGADGGADVARSPVLAMSLAGMATALHLARDRRNR